MFRKVPHFVSGGDPRTVPAGQAYPPSASRVPPAGGASAVPHNALFKTKPCADFQTNTCRHSDAACAFAHVKCNGVCIPYLRGNCQNGAECKYSHDYSRFMMASAPPSATSVRPSVRPSNSAASTSAARRPVEVLSPLGDDFEALVDDESWGRHHLTAASTRTARPPSHFKTKPCADFQTNTCHHGDACRFAHVKCNGVCIPYLRGNCQNVVGCKYSHDYSRFMMASAPSSAASPQARPSNSAASTSAARPPTYLLLPISSSPVQR